MSDVFDFVGGVVDDVTGFPGNLANKFGPNARQTAWNLVEGSFKNEETNVTTVFWVADSKKAGTQATALAQVSDGGGRRLAIYEYPYRDGQVIEDLGRRGERFSFEIKFFGTDYRIKLDRFIQNVVNQKGRGELSHPVRGMITARFLDWEFIHRHDEWNAVSIRATFVEDNLGKIAEMKLPEASSTNVSLRAALQAVTDAQAFISSSIYRFSSLLLLPSAIRDSLLNRLNSLGGQLSRLFGQIAVTFASDARIKSLALQAQGSINGLLGLYSGIISSAFGGTENLPPVYQVGYSPSDQDQINQQMNQFQTNHQITPGQAVFAANEIRQSISHAISETRTIFGNDGYDIEMAYREISIQVQLAVESAISSNNATVRVYVTPREMSVRQIAFKNNLNVDRQNEIEQLNPFLPSLNLVPKGTSVIVPLG